MSVAILYTTVSSIQDARSLADRLLKAKLAGCINIIQISESRYVWNGDITQEQEWALVIKTSHPALEKASGFLQQHHPYECPCIMTLPNIKTSHSFSQWISTMCEEQSTE
jgi:periplasmic divalent cation tolerance protein